MVISPCNSFHSFWTVCSVNGSERAANTWQNDRISMKTKWMRRWELLFISFTKLASLCIHFLWYTKTKRVDHNDHRRKSKQKCGYAKKVWSEEDECSIDWFKKKQQQNDLRVGEKLVHKAREKLLGCVEVCKKTGMNIKLKEKIYLRRRSEKLLVDWSDIVEKHTHTHVEFH